MRLSTLTTTLATLSLASARIVGIAAPAVLTPNTTFTLTLLTENYVQTVADIAVAWGFTPPTANNPTGTPFSLGAFVGSAYLGPNKSNVLTNVTVNGTVPAALASDAWYGKDIVLTAGVYSLYGASSGPTVTGFNVTVKVGSSEMVRSQGQSWIENGQ